MIAVVPLVGAWIETLCDNYTSLPGWSLPSRERGLKHHPKVVQNNISARRSLRGSVD